MACIHLEIMETKIFFKKKIDEFAIKSILRIAKEGVYMNGLKRKYCDTKQIYKKCLQSRNDHPNESFLTNMIYWPMDINIGLSNYDYYRYVILLLNHKAFRNIKRSEDKEFIKKTIRNAFRETNFFDECSSKCNLKHIIQEWDSFYKPLIKMAKRYKAYSNELLDNVEKNIKFIMNSDFQKIPF